MIKIRKMVPGDIKKLTGIWLNTSRIAHHFVPETYWIDNQALMEKEYLPNSEVYLAERENHILGFVALLDDHIAAIFVENEQQGQGIGSLLIEHAKIMRSELTLHVYQKNEKSVKFYQAKEFEIVAETMDPATGEKEFKMQWNHLSQSHQS